MRGLGAAKLDSTNPRKQRRPVSHLPRTLFATLLAVSLAAEPAHQGALTPPTTAPLAHPSWSEVERASGPLTFLRTLTGYALTAPVHELPVALAAVDHWPSSELHQDERRAQARHVLAHAYTTRAPNMAIAHHDLLSGEASLQFRSGFFTALASVELARAREELRKLPAGPERHQAAALIVTARNHTEPLAALALIADLSVTDEPTVLAVFESAARLDPLLALAALSSLPDTLRSDARQRIMTEWLLQDARTALAWITAQIPESDQPAFLDAVLKRAGRRNFALIISLETRAESLAVRAAANHTIKSQLHLHPVNYSWDRVLNHGWQDLLDTSSPADSHTPSASSSRIDQLARFAATRPPDEVRAVFESMPSGHVQDESAISDIMRAWTLADPHAALAWAEKLSDPDLRHHSLRQAQAMLVEIDPPLAFTRLQDMEPGDARTRMTDTTFKALAKKDLTAALTLTPFLDDILHQLYGAAAITRVASAYDPDAMIEFVRTSGRSDYLTGALATAWIDKDPDGALTWYGVLSPDNPLREMLRDDVVFQMARRPEFAIEQAIELPDGRQRTALIRALADRHAEHHPESIFALIESLPPSGERTEIRQHALRSFARKDPAAAAALFDSGIVSPQTRQDIDQIASAWAYTSAVDSARWLATHIRPGNNHPDLIEKAVPDVARIYARQDPASALAWSASLQDPHAAKQAATAVIDSISNRFPNVARRLIAASTLSAEEKARLLARIDH